MSKLTTRQKRDKRYALIKTAFLLNYARRFNITPQAQVFQSAGSDSWVVITDADDDAWVHIGGSDDDGFCFWGPLGKKSVTFNIPEGWPI